MNGKGALRLVALAGAAMLAGCASSGPIGLDPSIKVASLDDLPMPSNDDRNVTRSQYYVGIGDKLSIDVFGVEDLTRSVVTDSEGNFSFPLIGRVKGVGRTPNDIAAEIENRLRGGYVLKPQVAITVSEAASQMITVGGQVRTPGQYPAAPAPSLLRAVAAAGGVAEFGKITDVLVFRTVSGQKYIGLYNLGAIERGNQPDPAVFPSDVIIVGDSSGRRLFQDLLKILPVALSTALLIDRRR